MNSQDRSTKRNELSSDFTIEQRKWIIARLFLTSDAKAARAIGIHPATVCRWPNKKELDQAVADLLKDPQSQALAMLLDAVPEAARVKIDGLRSRKDQIRQSSATDILDRILGRATQKQEISGEMTHHIITVDWDDANHSEG